MKALKYITLLLIMLTAAAIFYAGFIYLHCTVDIVQVQVNSTASTQAYERFASDVQAIQNKTIAGRVFSQIDDTQDYYYVDYNVQIKNNLFVDMNAIELQILPKTGDVFQAEVAPAHIAKQSDGIVNATILSSKNNIGTRDLQISYYVWGIPFSMRYTYGAK
ncbi:MAG: hypothetical protein SPL05_01520 [Eubacteriales bacterium]|nr:hypothetical protein [Eubacteriales bacterium]